MHTDSPHPRRVGYRNEACLRRLGFPRSLSPARNAVTEGSAFGLILLLFITISALKRVGFKSC